MAVPDLFVNMIVEACIWDSKKPITLNEPGPKIHIKPTSVLFFWTKIVSYTSPSAEYISCSKYMVPTWRLNLKLSKSSVTFTWSSSWSGKMKGIKDPWALMVAWKMKWIYEQHITIILGEWCYCIELCYDVNKNENVWYNNEWRWKRVILQWMMMKPCDTITSNNTRVNKLQ